MDTKHSMEDILKHYGANLPYSRHGWIKMRCCFHDDSHASASVNLEENAFKCFACGMQGDVYDLIMEREGLTFVKAKQFAERISPAGGNELRSGRGSSRRVSRKPRTNLGRRSEVLGGRS